jgi:hypothetical protein
MGRMSSAIRIADQTIYSWFWAQSTATYLWNHVVDSLIERGDREEDDDDSGRWGERRSLSDMNGVASSRPAPAGKPSKVPRQRHDA